MKRVLIILCCICLIVCLAAPAFAVSVFSWEDYVVSTTPGYDTDRNDVFIPASASGQRWRFLKNGANFATSSGSTLSFTLPDEDASWVLILQQQDLLALSLDNIDTSQDLDLHFDISGSLSQSLQYRVYVLPYDSEGKRVSPFYTDWLTVDSFGDVTLSVDLSTLPEGAVSFSFNVYFDYSSYPAGDVSVTYHGLSFDVLTPGTLTRPTPITIHPQDYIVNESSNGDTSTLYVSVPSSDLDIGWNTARNDDFSVLSEFHGNPYNVDLPVADYGYWIGCQVFNKLDITDIVNGSTLEVDFNIDYPSGVAVPYGFPVRYQVRYFDVDGQLLDTVRFFSLSGNYGLDNTTLNMVIDKPEGAVSMSFLLQYMDIPVNISPYKFTLELESVNFVCDIPTMVRVQQETGRTNKLLDELVNGDHGFDSSGSNFGSEADQLAGAGDQMNNAMGSGMNSLGSMTNSVAFTGTLTTLAGVMDAVFVGHEITICGVTANPFTLLVSIFAIAILLPLGLKFVFRKWGSGGG